MDISKLPHCDFIIHRKLVDAKRTYFIPARGSGKFVTTREFDQWERLNERTRDEFQEIFNEMLNNHIRKTVNSHIYISTGNPYIDFKPFLEHDSYIYSPGPLVEVSFSDYFIKGVSDEQT